MEISDQKMNKQQLFTLGRPFSPLYGMVMRLRERCYQRGIFKVTRFPVPVVSVGNLTLGGTGKTPLVQYLARLLQARGFSPAVISRGYGGSTKKPVNVVSDGRETLLPAERVGDEPRLLAETLPGVPVLTGVVRKLPARHAIDMGANVLLLDDGFQHMAIARDLDLVLFSADVLAGNSRIFPGGDLREPVKALHRASCFVLTGVNALNQERAEKFTALLQQKWPEKNTYRTACRPTGFVQRDARHRFVFSKSKPSGLNKTFALCGIAHPDSFRKTLLSCGIDPIGFLALEDHHMYKERDVRKIVSQVKAADAQSVLVTEKDMVKLDGVDFGVLLYAVRIEAQAMTGFDDMIIDTVNAIRGQSGSR